MHGEAKVEQKFTVCCHWYAHNLKLVRRHGYERAWDKRHGCLRLASSSIACPV